MSYDTGSGLAYCRSSSGGDSVPCSWHGPCAKVDGFKTASLPSAAAAYGLSRGVAKINEKLPGPVYALLSGLNAATVGVVALAAVQLSQKAITDKITRILVFFGGAAGVLYNALWYFPVLMVVGGGVTVFWDYGWGHRMVGRVRRLFSRESRRLDVDLERRTAIGEGTGQAEMKERRETRKPGQVGKSTSQDAGKVKTDGQQKTHNGVEESVDTHNQGSLRSNRWLNSWKVAVATLVAFFAFFVTVMVLRGVLKNPTREFSLFANLFLAGMCYALYA